MFTNITSYLFGAAEQVAANDESIIINNNNIEEHGLERRRYADEEDVSEEEDYEDDDDDDDDEDADSIVESEDEWVVVDSRDRNGRHIRQQPTLPNQRPRQFVPCQLMAVDGVVERQTDPLSSQKLGSMPTSLATSTGSLDSTMASSDDDDDDDEEEEENDGGEEEVASATVQYGPHLPPNYRRRLTKSGRRAIVPFGALTRTCDRQRRRRNILAASSLAEKSSRLSPARSGSTSNMTAMTADKSTPSTIGPNNGAGGDGVAIKSMIRRAQRLVSDRRQVMSKTSKSGKTVRRHNLATTAHRSQVKAVAPYNHNLSLKSSGRNKQLKQC